VTAKPRAAQISAAESVLGVPNAGEDRELRLHAERYQCLLERHARRGFGRAHHLIVLDEQHLPSVLRECVPYYNQERPHRTLGLQTPQLKVRPSTGIVRARPVLNGLHQIYERAA
jgi:transposase InsO family protein